MKYFKTALSAEWLKFCNALLPKLATVGIVGVISVIGPVSMIGRGEDSPLLSGSWVEYFDSTALTISTAGLFGFGIVLVWLFGREFADGTIAGLFALPLSRGKIALAKIVLFVLWVEGTVILLSLALLLVGAVIGLGPLNADGFAALGRLFVISILTAFLTFPFALVATISRDYLAPIGAILAVAIITSVIGSLEIGVWFPFAIPGLWAAGAIGQEGNFLLSFQIMLVGVTALVFEALTVREWARLQM